MMWELNAKIGSPEELFMEFPVKHNLVKSSYTYVKIIYKQQFSSSVNI